jgi:hypothetical protein
MQLNSKNRMNSHNRCVRQILHAAIVVTLFAATNLFNLHFGGKNA